MSHSFIASIFVYIFIRGLQAHGFVGTLIFKLAQQGIHTRLLKESKVHVDQTYRTAMWKCVTVLRSAKFYFDRSHEN